MKRIVNYANALTHLYGIVAFEKVVEIYNMQNKTKWTLEKAIETFQENEEVLEKNFVYPYRGYLVHETVLEENNFEELVQTQQAKPFYIPEQDELLQYTNEYYVEDTKEYEALELYLFRNFFKDDRNKAKMVAEDIQGQCQFYYSLDDSLKLLEERGVTFKQVNQYEEVVQLIVTLRNTTRLRENNGFTPTELFSHFSNIPLASLGEPIGRKVGRNEPCPCGSGKKYKKCCLNK